MMADKMIWMVKQKGPPRHETGKLRTGKWDFGGEQKDKNSNAEHAEEHGEDIHNSIFKKIVAGGCDIQRQVGQSTDTIEIT